MEWFNCPACQHIVEKGQAKCNSCGMIFDSAQPVGQPATQTSTRTKSAAGITAVVIILVLIIAAVISNLATKQEPPAAATPPPPAVDIELQQKRLSAINELTTVGVFYKVDKPGTFAHVWVTPLFYALDYDKKQVAISVVYAYYITEDPKSECVLLFDSRTGKQVGKYAVIYGGLEMQ